MVAETEEKGNSRRGSDGTKSLTTEDTNEHEGNPSESPLHAPSCPSWFSNLGSLAKRGRLRQSASPHGAGSRATTCAGSSRFPDRSPASSEQIYAATGRLWHRPGSQC